MRGSESWPIVVGHALACPPGVARAAQCLGKLKHAPLIFICLQAAFCADGVVLDDRTGSPVASATVRVFQGAQSSPAAYMDTDRDGRFRVPSIPPGEYRIEIAKPDFVRASIRLSISADTPAFTFRLPPCGAIAGHVLDEQGQPAAGAHVDAMARPADGGAYRRTVATAPMDDQGAYRINNLAPGQYDLVVHYGSGAMLYPKVFTVLGGEELSADFAFRTSGFNSVTGRAVLPSPRLRLSAALTPVDQPTLAAATATPDEYGKFIFPRVRSGSYNLFLSGPPVGSGSNGAEIEDELHYSRTRVEVGGERVEGLVVEVPRGRTASFQLSPAAGCPAVARLTLVPLEDWGANVERAFLVETTKETVVVDLAPTRFQMILSQTGPCFQASAATVDLTSTAGSQPVTVAIAPSGSLRGKLTGDSVSGVAVVLLPVDAIAGGQPMLVALPGADGKFEFTGLAPGHYRLAAERSPWVSDIGKMFDIEVVGATPLELDLPAPR